MVCAVTNGGAARALTLLLALAAMTAAPSQALAEAPQPPVEELRIPFPEYDGGLTPYTFELGYPLMTLIYDTLMLRDVRGVPRPWLARTVPQRSEDGRRVTVELRDDVRWHDGRRLTAADVAFTFRLLAERPQPRFTPQLADLEQVRATGRLTVVFDLRRPSLGFEDQPLADVPIVPAHLWRDLPDGRLAPSGHAVGSGPYTLTRASRTAGYVLTANERYFRGRPRVQRLRVPFMGDADETFEALKQRRIDMVPLSLPRDNAVDLDRSLGIAVRRGPFYVGTALVLNTRRAPFDDPAARQAVSQALDLRLIVRNVAPAEPALGGFVHPRSRWAAQMQVHESNPAAARRALADLNLPPIRLLSPENDPVRAEAARQVALALRRVGATVTVVDQSAEQLSRAVGEEGGTPDFEAAITSTPALVSHDPNYLRAMFGSDPQTATLNVTGYSSDEFDSAAQRVAGARVPGPRERAINEELRLLSHAAPAIPLFFSQGAFAFRNEIYGGWAFVRGTGIFDKRSFMSSTAPARPGAPAATTTPEEEDDTGLDILSVISLVLLAGLGALAVYAVARRRT